MSYLSFPPCSGGRAEWMLRMRFRNGRERCPSQFSHVPEHKTRSTLWLESSAWIAWSRNASFSYAAPPIQMQGTPRELQHSGVAIVAEITLVQPRAHPPRMPVRPFAHLCHHGKPTCSAVGALHQISVDSRRTLGRINPSFDCGPREHIRNPGRFNARKGEVHTFAYDDGPGSGIRGRA